MRAGTPVDTVTVLLDKSHADGKELQLPLLPQFGENRPRLLEMTARLLIVMKRARLSRQFELKQHPVTLQ